MSNCYAPCFYGIDFVVISSFIELPWNNKIFINQSLSLYRALWNVRKKIWKDKTISCFYVINFSMKVSPETGGQLNTLTHISNLKDLLGGFLKYLN